MADRKDHDPSRAGAEPGLLPRLAPVVYGNPGDAPLSADLLQRFAEEGFLHFERFSTENELAAVTSVKNAMKEPFRNGLALRSSFIRSTDPTPLHPNG